MINSKLYKGYYRSSKVDYMQYALKRKSLEDSFLIGVFHREGGCLAEFTIDYDTKISCVITIYSDALILFDRCKDLFEYLSSLRTPPSMNQLENKLIELGYENGGKEND